jgi:hypothetical protein
MNSSNPLDQAPLNQVNWQRWKPRQPSPKVYRRIFGAEREDEVAFGLRDFSRWLVPAFGCFLLVLANLSTHLPGRFALQLADTNVPSFSDQMSMATLPGAQQHSEVNSYPAREYEWSFAARHSTAAMTAGSILVSYTNKLIQ